MKLRKVSNILRTFLARAKSCDATYAGLYHLAAPVLTDRDRIGEDIASPAHPCSLPAMSDRLHAFSVDELYSLVFRLDVAETVEPLDEVAAQLRDEMLRELKERAQQLKTSSRPTDEYRSAAPSNHSARND